MKLMVRWLACLILSLGVVCHGVEPRPYAILVIGILALLAVAVADIAAYLEDEPGSMTTPGPHGLQPGDLVEISGRLRIVTCVTSSSTFECVDAPWYTRLHHYLSIRWHNHAVRAAADAEARRRLRYEGRDLPRRERPL